MRITGVLLMLTFYCASAGISYSQKTEISLEVQSGTLKEVLDAIKVQSEYSFWYRNEDLNLDKQVTAQFRKQNIRQVLDDLLTDDGLSYTIDDKHIIIYKKETLAVTTIQQQGRKITGMVTDERNEPIIGANVIVKGTTNGIITDFDGNFSLEIPEDAILQVSYIGYIAMEVSVGNQSVLNIRLKEDTQALDEIIVVGYGTVKKSNLTGAVSSVKTTEIQQTPMTSIDQGLVGRASGVQVTQT
ncbi:MAG: carboxypeptidase-like regulatory domain-containing protein, partial [Tannerellaceae bacterium]|nr:carboxypeptidase-like regulatory domain-containing protein [Tannerellaceae bacterium]